MGLAGGLPYVGASLTTLYVARQAAKAAEGVAAHVDPASAVAFLDSCMQFQATYGAVMLSFLGALHWGMEFAKYGGYKGYPRLILGVAPLLGAWPTLAMEPQLALVAQWVLFTTLWYADMKATMAGWTPNWFSQYRFYLSILVGTCILGTLFGVNYFGPTTDVVLAKNLKETGVQGSSFSFMDTAVREAYEAAKQKKRYAPSDANYWTEEGRDGFVRIMKKWKEGGKGEGNEEDDFRVDDDEGDAAANSRHESKASREGDDAQGK